jgi:hypothetical protein
MSAATGSNPFAITRGMTQPLNKTKAVKGFEGNIDFEKAEQVVNVLRTSGRDLNMGNPYLQKRVIEEAN